MSVSLSTLLSSLGAIAGAAALLILAAAMGLLVLARMRLTRRSVWKQAAVGTGIGLGILSYLAFLLGMASLLTPVTVRVMLLLCVVLTAALWRLPARSQPSSKPEESKLPAEPPVWWVVFLLGAAGVFLLCALAACLSPLVDYDGLAYHVAAPRRWLELGGLRALPTHLMAEWPMGCEMLFLLLLPLTGASACKPLMALLTLATAIAVFALGSRLAGRTVGCIAAALFVLGSGLDRINTTSIEMALTFYTVLTACALAAAQDADRPEERPRWLLLAAFLAGMVNCVKLNGLVIMLVLALVVLALPRRPGVRFIARFREAAWFAGIALLCAAPWYARTWRDTGNPIYPFAFSLFGGRDWNAEASALISTYFHYFDLPGASLAARQAVLIRHLVKAALVLSAALLLPGPRWTRDLLLAAGAFALIQMAMSDQWRFLLPALPFFVIVLAWWVARVAARLPLAGWAAALAAAVYILPGAAWEAAKALPSAVNREARAAQVQRYINNYAACLWANQHLPPDARVLFGPDTRTYYLQRDAYWSHPILQQLVRFDTAQAFKASVQNNRITYLIFNRRIYDNPELNFEVNIGWRRLERQRMEELAQRSRRVFAANGVEIYQLTGERAWP